MRSFGGPLGCCPGLGASPLLARLANVEACCWAGPASDGSGVDPALHLLSSVLAPTEAGDGSYFGDRRGDVNVPLSIEIVRVAFGAETSGL